MTKPNLSLKKRLLQIRLPVESSKFLEQLERFCGVREYLIHAPSLFNQNAKYNIRNRSLFFAQELLENKFEGIETFYSALKKKAYSMGHESEIENMHSEHILFQIESLIHKPELRRQVLQLKLPLMNQKIDLLIRSSLRLSDRDKLQDQEIQLLCLSAFLTPLRQSVGSCFATAPAILIQKEQPELFFQDLEDLLNIGMLKRTFSGHEHSIPLSPSWGLGSLDQPLVLRKEDKPWESHELRCAIDLLSPNETEEEKKEALKKLLFTEMNLEGGEILTLNKILKKMLLSKHGLNEKDIKTQKKAFQALNLLSVSSPNTSSKVEKYKEELKKAQLHLIQLEDHLFLKSWEYTLASFAESKSDFYKWNLHTALGFNSDEEWGISQAIFNYLQSKMEQNNQEIEKLTQEYEQEYFRVKYLEKKVQDTESDRMATWARMEYQNHVNDLNRLLHARDNLVDKTNLLAKFLPKLIKQYDEILPRYFQELYDAQMQDYTKGIFEDAPAGFRLIYKYGRSDPSLWTFISSRDEFLEVLKNFFTLTENEILSHEEFKDFEKEILEIGTVIVNLIYMEEFILGAFARISKRYKLPFTGNEDLDKLPYKPWSYISGGTLKGLLTNYFKRDIPFHEEQKKVTSETELLSFFIESIRLLPDKELQLYLDNPDRSMLMYSPTHAFLFKPGWMPLEQLWDKRLYSYTWIRDEVILPKVQSLNPIDVSPAHVLYFLETYTSNNPYLLLWLKENIVWPNYSLPLKDFRELIYDSLPKIPRNVSSFPLTEELIDGWIYEFFPLTHPKELPEILFNLKQLLLKDSSGAIEVLADLPIHSPFIHAGQLFSICKALFLIHLKKREGEKNWPLLILNALRELRLAMPEPLFFADTNWPYFNFAFVVNPATHKLEFWRVDSIGRVGFPMKIWDQYFDEQNPSLWSIFIKPSEYQAQEPKSFYNPI